MAQDKAKIPSAKRLSWYSSEAGSKRTAKDSRIAKINTEKSKNIKNMALILRGKSAKCFKIKLEDTEFNGSM